MNMSLLLDSNILVDYLRNRSEAVEFVDSLQTLLKFRRSPSRSFTLVFAKGGSERFWTNLYPISRLLMSMTRLR